MLCRKIQLITALLFFAALYPGYANLRAPYHREYKGSNALQKIEGVTVISENLEFSFDHYFTGDAGKVSAEKNFCIVKAEYTVNSDSDKEAEFNFISPSAEDAAAEINSSISAITSSVIDKTPESSQARWSIFYEDLYSLKFTGKLINGKNTITVKYKQPAGVVETSYGYFTKSRWFTFAIYEFAPIKEWKRSSDFKAEITVSVPYDWGIMDSVFSADIELDAAGHDKDYKVRYTPESGKLQKTGKNVSRKFIFKDELPDKITVSVSEK